MNLKEIKEMITLMNENNLSEIEIERDGTKIKLKKSALEETAQIISHRPPELNIHSLPSAAYNHDQPEVNKKGQGVAIPSPMVGTFYRAPSPEAAPFIEVGQIVEVGQVVCIVEAMKLMNEIKSEVKGKVVEVAVENAEPVEFGQALFFVEPI
jgi:acetyl-CoA carboxylase biotin carboxyl carrier protein